MLGILQLCKKKKPSYRQLFVLSTVPNKVDYAISGVFVYRFQVLCRVGAIIECKICSIVPLKSTVKDELI